MKIRPIRNADALRFRAVVDAVCQERRYLATFGAPPPDEVRKFVASNVLKKLPQFVAEVDGKVVGWCDVIPGRVTSAHVGTLGMGVLREFRGRRIGVSLLEATIARTRQIGLEKIELSVWASNLAAIALYRKLGFVDEGLRKRARLIDGMYDDVLLMALDLRPPASQEEAGA